VVPRAAASGRGFPAPHRGPGLQSAAGPPPSGLHRATGVREQPRPESTEVRPEINRNNSAISVLFIPFSENGRGVPIGLKVHVMGV